MKFSKIFLLTALVFGPGYLSSVVAEEAVTSDSFDSGELSKNWAAAKGTWEIVDGQLKGSELESDKHAAVVTYKSPHTDSKVEVSFQLNGSKGFSLSFNHPKGHLFRVNISETDLKIITDKDKKDPASKSVLLASEKAAFEQGKMYTMTCETKGDTATVEIGDLKLEGKHESLSKPKTGYRLVLKGDGVSFDNFKILSQG